jgi:RNA recognition motif-containing protein
MHIYVGNLPHTTTDDELRAMFAPYGEVKAATVGKDKKTGEPQGYGFVDMPVKSEGRAAIEALRGKTLGTEPLRVRALKPGDDFHQAAVRLHGGGSVNGRGSFRGDVPARAGDAIRRSGKRGS